jgi:1,4-dihydroxy-6-naphthoate synthase
LRADPLARAANHPAVLNTPLILAHSPDPDDAFMWWPITGKVRPDGSPTPHAPVLDTSGLVFRALPADIEALNRRAAADADCHITALSFRAWCDVKDRYVITRCGSSFGDGFGPKVIAGPSLAAKSAATSPAALLQDPGVRIAIPGRRTTAFLLLNMLIKGAADPQHPRFIEMPFDQVIGAVASGRAEAGLVIHEGQLLFQDAGLELIVDLGAWWKDSTGLPVPLGCNAARRDIDTTHGPGTLARVARLLRQSIEYALAHRDESIDYTMPFALANAARPGAESSGLPTRERVDRYVSMYVNRWTVDMGDDGIEAVSRLLLAGHAAGLCPHPGTIDAI